MHRLGDRVQLTPKGFKYRDILSWMFYSGPVKDLDREYYETLLDPGVVSATSS
ncbi:hypothetical protein STENM223S_00535 [Streptomyces tendae]